MNNFGIISEYNPFHSGHLYHIKKTLEKSSKLIVAMSGSFTQRGDCAIENKYLRAIKAIKAGADIVIEIPTLFSISPADKFAYGAISALSNFNISHLSFGSENGNIEDLKKLANLEEDKILSAKIQDFLKKGYHLAQAKSCAIQELHPNLAELSPNNTLGIEYIKNINQLNLDIQPFTIKRKGNDYNDDCISGENISATAIRNAIYQNKYNEIAKYLPYQTNFCLENNYNLGNLLLYKLNMTSKVDLAKIYDVTEGLENRFLNNLNKSIFEDYLKTIKTKRYTLARLKRILIYNLLDITKDFYAKNIKNNEYINVLAVKKSSINLLSEIKTKNIITKPSDIKRVDDNVLKMINLDNKAYNIQKIINQDKTTLNNMQVVAI